MIALVDSMLLQILTTIISHNILQNRTKLFKWRHWKFFSPGPHSGTSCWLSTSHNSTDTQIRALDQPLAVKQIRQCRQNKWKIFELIIKPKNKRLEGDGRTRPRPTIRKPIRWIDLWQEIQWAAFLEETYHDQVEIFWFLFDM